MIIFFAGDTHGRLNLLYDNILKLENQLGITTDWVLQTGNLGVWPDPNLADKATRKYGGNKDFSEYYLQDKPVPRQTLFVAGKHEDHRWLDIKYKRGEMELLPNLHWLVTGYSTVLVDQEDRLKVLGLGKVYSPIVYSNVKCQSNKKQGKYTRGEIEKACSQGPTDLILAHQAPSQAKLGNLISASAGLANVCFATRPKLYVHGHYNCNKEYDNPQTGTPTLSLSYNEILPFEYHNGKFTSIY